MTGAAWFLLALGIAGAAYSVYFAVHFFRHRERRRVERRARTRRLDSADTPDTERRTDRERRRSGRRDDE